MRIKLESGTTYNLSADGNRLDVMITKNGVDTLYTAPVGNSMKGGTLLVKRSNGSYVNLPVRKMGVEDSFRAFMESHIKSGK